MFEQRNLGLLALAVSFLLAACGQTSLPPNSDSLQASPLPEGWTEAQLAEDPTFYDESELLPNDGQVLQTNQVICCMVMKVKTVITSTNFTNRGNAFVGYLDNRNKTAATLTNSFTRSWSGSATGGVDYSKLKLDLSISGSRSYTASLTKRVPGKTKYRVFAHATGKAFKGYQTKRPLVYENLPCTAANHCVQRAYDAFRAEGMGFTTY